MTERPFIQAEVDALIAAAYEYAANECEGEQREAKWFQNETRTPAHICNSACCTCADIVRKLTPADARKALDDKIAAERALFAQNAAKHCPFVLLDSASGKDWHIQCTCGWDGREAIKQSWPAHILALADSKALAEHDAALREEATYKEHISHLEFEAEMFSILVDPVEDGGLHEAEFREVTLKAARDQRQAIYDVQNDNAALREQVTPMECGHPKSCAFEYTETGTEYDSAGYPVPVPIPARSCTTCVREKKLEAENAAFREALREADQVIDWTNFSEESQRKERRRALLGEKI